MAKSNENPINQSSQQTEINSLRDYFKDNIRILSSIGQFSYILKIQVHQYDVSLTLQLDGMQRIEHFSIRKNSFIDVFFRILSIEITRNYSNCTTS